MAAEERVPSDKPTRKRKPKRSKARRRKARELTKDERLTALLAARGTPGPRGSLDARTLAHVRRVREEREREREERRRALEQDPFVQKAEVICKNLRIALDAVTDPSRSAGIRATARVFERYVHKMAYAELLVNATSGPTREQRLQVLFLVLADNCTALSRGEHTLAGQDAEDAAKMTAREYAFAFPDSPVSVEALRPVVTSWLDKRRGRKPKGVLGKYEALRRALHGTPLERYSAAAIETEHHKWVRARKRKT